MTFYQLSKPLLTKYLSTNVTSKRKRGGRRKERKGEKKKQLNLTELAGSIQLILETLFSDVSFNFPTLYKLKFKMVEAICLLIIKLKITKT